jgi:hypothetical protein
LAGIGGLVSKCEHLELLVLEACHGVDDQCLSLIAQHCHQLKDLSLYSETVSAKAVLGLIMRCHSLNKLHVQGNQQFQLVTLPDLAEDIYNELNHDATCRSSQLKSIKLISVGHTFVRLVTVLCSQLVSLSVDSCNLQDVSDVNSILVHCIETCSLLKTLDISTIANISDTFLAVICERALELRHLSVFFGQHVSNEMIGSVIQILPSLSTLTVGVTEQHCDEQFDFDDDFLVEIANRFHQETCYLRVFNMAPTSGEQLQFEFSFVPLKYMRCHCDIVS